MLSTRPLAAVGCLLGGGLRRVAACTSAGAADCSPSTSGRGYASMPDTVRSAFGFCVQQVRQYDYPNYVWVAQMDKDLRPALFALRAFNIETALVADQVRSKESVVGQIRFQWWRDAVRAAYEDRPPNHPVAIALAHVLHSPGPKPSPAVAAPAPPSGAHADTGCGDSGCGGDSPRSSAAAAAAASTSSSAAAAASSGPGRFSRYSFKRIIDVRESDFLDPQPPLDLGALETYAEGTASQLLYLQLAAAGVKHRDADHAASHLGRAVGITTLLRGTAAHAAARRSYLPVDLCAEARVSQEDVYSGAVSEGLRDVVHKVASLAKGHLDEARRLAPRLPAGAAGLMLPAVAVDRYLQALEAVNFDPYDSGLLKQHGGGEGAAPLSYVLAVKWHQLRGTY
ncbi:hypothetical protein HYH02_012617 [Chlamydomonas schloesseri]|uniref:Phytoene synthase n=1 Tax=Chlamydomonas schloesseri TaxID=2026947 RepID=A0A835W1H0_9CHLO|nr:hypothetical protein HYH02_012617 [Chlamydomonas schloesseri]|eukprot:KAG2433499.1 hypothetical protein HYH02_012617 [Chlamydomonas schloesseri]